MDAFTAPRMAPLAGRRPAALLRLAGDDRLVSEVRAGSETAFEAVYDRHHRGVLGFCRHMLGSREEAEDAVQHTFMAAYRDLQGSDKVIQLKPWLYTIARNRCVSILRARREQPSDEIELSSLDGLTAEVQRREDLRDLVRDVAALPEDQRAALVLAEVGDVTHAEIAAVLDVPTPKVKALVFQARTSLMASRDARDTPCQEIQEQLANLHGGSLRRTTLRRHLRECPGCREFRTKLTAQRAGLALALPVLPALGFKENVLAAVFGGGGGGAGGAAAAVGLGGGGFGVVAAKGFVAALAVGAGVAGVAAMSPDAGSSSNTPPAETRGAEGSGDGGSGSGGKGGVAAGAAAPGSSDPDRESGDGELPAGADGQDEGARGRGAPAGWRSSGATTGSESGDGRRSEDDRRDDRQDDVDARGERPTGDGAPGTSPDRDGGDDDGDDDDGRAKKPRKAKKPKGSKPPKAPKPARSPGKAPGRDRPKPTPTPKSPPKPKPKPAATATPPAATPAPTQPPGKGDGDDTDDKGDKGGDDRGDDG